MRGYFKTPGNFKAPGVAMITSAPALRLARSSTRVLVGFIKGEGNTGDKPSRPSDSGALESLTAIGANRFPFVIASLRGWEFR